MSQTSKKIIGIDPGLNFSGYGIVEICGNKLTHILSGSIGPAESAGKIPERIKYNFEKLTEIIKEGNPDEMVLESIFYSRNVRMAIELSHIRGALILSAKLLGIPVYEYSPLEIKQAVAGYGKASKDQVHKMITVILKNPQIKDSHASDALAAAICHAHSSSLSTKIRDMLT